MLGLSSPSSRVAAEPQDWAATSRLSKSVVRQAGGRVAQCHHLQALTVLDGLSETR